MSSNYPRKALKVATGQLKEKLCLHRAIVCYHVIAKSNINFFIYLGSHLCQHIIGMSPKKIGAKIDTSDIKAKSPDDQDEVEMQGSANSDKLLNQSFILSPLFENAVTEF